MKVLHVGPKNYPPAHGGVEKSVYDLIHNSINIDSFILVEWDQVQSEKVRVLPKGFISRIREIYSFAKEEKIQIIHFNLETFIPYSIIFSLFSKFNIIHTIRGCAWRIKRWAWYYRIAFYLFDLFGSIVLPKLVFVGLIDYQHFSKIVFWKKLYYIPNGIKYNDHIASSDNSKCVYIGRISPEKNILNLIKLFNDGFNKLSIYGPFDRHDKTYKKKVLEAIKSNPNVNYLGTLKHNEIFSTLSNYNTFCNLSFSEGMPVAVLEAASVGLNLVLSSIAQHKNLDFPDVCYLDPNLSGNTKWDFNSVSAANKAYLYEKYSIASTVENYKKLYNN